MMQIELPKVEGDTCQTKVCRVFRSAMSTVPTSAVYVLPAQLLQSSTAYSHVSEEKGEVSLHTDT